MSKFNATVPKGKTKTTNLAGGTAYSESAELALASLVLTSFLKDKFYESGSEQLSRIQALVPLCEPSFVAKLAVFARKEYGMRSVSHVLASEIAKHIPGKLYAEPFYTAVVKRPDDILEILAYHLQFNGKLSAAMKRGLAASFDKFDTYQLAKYKGESKGISLVDAVNLLHPTPIYNNAEGLKALVRGELKAHDTWENELSAAGADPKSKEAVWTKLLNENKLGYFALLRNLRNISEQATAMLPEAAKQLVNQDAIKKSMVLPFRFMTAIDEMYKLSNTAIANAMIYALNTAMDISLSNVPKFEGSTLVVVDTSGSMQGEPSKIASLFAAVLLKANPSAELMIFAMDAQYRVVNSMDSISTIANNLRFGGGGTNFQAIFQKANKAYDRVIILSDMQAWMQGYQSPVQAYNSYKAKYKCNPFVYSFDLAGHGTLQLPEPNVFCLAGFSDKTMELMGMLEQDKHALLNKIKAVTL